MNGSAWTTIHTDQTVMPATTHAAERQSAGRPGLGGGVFADKKETKDQDRPGAVDHPDDRAVARER